MMTRRTIQNLIQGAGSILDLCPVPRGFQFDRGITYRTPVEAVQDSFGVVEGHIRAAYENTFSPVESGHGQQE